MTTKPYWRDIHDGMKYRPVLIFEGGEIEINGSGYGDKDGAGRLIFKDDDLDWDEGTHRVVRLDRSELEAIRKHIAECHGPYSDANPTVTDNDAGEITVTLDGRELRGWSYSSDDERRNKMMMARDYVEGWCDGRDAMTPETIGIREP